MGIQRRARRRASWQPAALADGLRRQPATTKELLDGAGRGGRLAFGVAAMQGWREEMEDAHLALPDFDLQGGLSLFGVFDGHGGSAVASVVAERLPAVLRGLPSYQQGRHEEALREAYMRLDEFLGSPAGRKELRRRAPGEMPEGMGSTAVVALVKGGNEPELLVANAGDSRCVLVSGSTAIAMSKDHSPRLPAELHRIKQAGGFVNCEGRVNGNLNLSRALGDFFYKRNHKLKPEEQMITAMPDVRRRRLGGDDRYLVLGCDGIWERTSNQGVVDILLAHLAYQGRKKPTLSRACARFLDANLSKNPVRTQGLGCDNMTLALVDLRSTQAGPRPRAPVGPAGSNGSMCDATPCVPIAPLLEGQATARPSPAARRRQQTYAWLCSSQRRRVVLLRHRTALKLLH